MHLYEINTEIALLMQQLEVDEETGEILTSSEDILQQLNALDMERSRILEYLAKVVLDTRAEAAALKAEEERLAKRRRVCEHREERLIEVLDRECYLCPIKAQMIPLGLDISGVGVSEGDYRADEIGSALEPYLAQIADEMQEYCRGRKTVVFLPLVSTSRKFCAMLRERGFRAAEVNGESPDRAQLLEDFDRGRYDILTNSMLLTEGWDCPSVDCIINLRPTKVRSLYQQIIGRGLRLSPGKEYLLVLDFLWQTERLDLCRPSCLVCRDENEAERVDRMVEDTTGAVDLMEAEEQAERDTILEREQSLARQLAEMRSRRRRLVDPLQFAMSIAAEDLADYTPTFAWEMAPPSQKQLDFLEKRGIDAGSIENMGKASMLIDRLMNRQKEGLSTPKQIRLLERYGFRFVGTWSFDAASKVISRLAALNRKLPYGFNPATYVPS